MVLASRLIRASAALWACGCATQKVSFDFEKNLGLVDFHDGRACLSLATPHKAGYPVLIILPEPQDTTYTAHINDGTCQAEEGMIGHPLSFKTDDPLLGFGVVLNGRSPSRDVDHDGQNERFRVCASRDGLHFTVWSGEVRRWHRFHYLGNNTEANCTDAETRP
jgi:hypothetical protein